MTRKRRILAVDDDRLVLTSLGRTLERLGYEVVEASNAAQALSICEANAPELVILDIRMPGMSGIDAAARIQEIGDIPIIFLSGFSDRDIVEQALNNGGLTYLVKPLSEAQLQPAIAAAFARSDDIRALRESEKGLNKALESDRLVSIAIGLVMERANMNSENAFASLRQLARTRQARLQDVAQEIVQAAETLSNISQARLRA